MLSVRLSFLSPQGPFPWYEHPEPSRNAANTHLTSMLDPQGGSHPLSLRSHYRFKALGSRGRMQGYLRDAGVVGGVKGESLAWPLSRRSTKGAPKAWGNPQSRVGTAAQWPARDRPTSGPAYGGEGARERAGAGPLEAQAPGPGSAAGSALRARRPGQVRSQGNANQVPVARAVRAPSNSRLGTPVNWLWTGAEGPPSPRGLVTFGAAREAQPSGRRQSSARFGWLRTPRSPACVESGGGGGTPRRERPPEPS